MDANLLTPPITDEPPEHADFDRSKAMNLIRLINLLSTSWKLQRGRGPHCESFQSPLQTDTYPYARYTAYIKVAPFSPDYVLQCALHDRKPIIFLGHSQLRVRNLRFFAVDMELLLAYAAIGRLPDSGKPIMTFPPENTNTYCEKSYGGWIMIDLGNNIFRMCTFISKDVAALFEKLNHEGVNVRTMTADTFNQEAEQRGGLATVLNDMELIKDEKNLRKLRDDAEEFMCSAHPDRSNEDQAAYFHLFAALTGVRTSADASNGRLKSFLKQWHADLVATMEDEALKKILSKIDVPPGWKVLSSTKFLPPPGTAQQDVYDFLNMIAEKCPEKFVEVLDPQTPNFDEESEQLFQSQQSQVDDHSNDKDIPVSTEAHEGIIDLKEQVAEIDSPEDELKQAAKKEDTKSPQEKDKEVPGFGIACQFPLGPAGLTPYKSKEASKEEDKEEHKLAPKEEEKEEHKDAPKEEDKEGIAYGIPCVPPWEVFGPSPYTPKEALKEEPLEQLADTAKLETH
ncbi:hypothetical protein B0A52_00948 [Exophiala mesophila]|uniref:Uncharacterized protein n=1 Tax=Exophiala mesophila TaxID=212818 RepID=A0A438NIN6_EXOME|nr:hypothetical protein B0A52_00948 [Exophiala mesophila]